MNGPGDPRFEALDALEARVAELEAEVAALRAESIARPPVASLPLPPPDSPPFPPPPSPQDLIVATPPPPTGPGAPANAASAAHKAAPRPGVALESETVLKWAGVGLVVLAVGFAVSTAISRGWIGPELQLAGAVGLSAALIAVGFQVRATRLPWTHALCSGGVAALFTTFASNLFLDQTSRDTALIMVAVVVAVGYLVGRFVPSEWVGVVSLAGGLIAWLVVSDGDLRLAPTLAFVVAGSTLAVALSLERRWFGLRLLGHTTALLMILAVAADADTGPSQVAVVASTVLVFLSLVRVPSIGDVDDPWLQVEVQLSAVAGPWVLAVLANGFEIENRVDFGIAALAIAASTAAVSGAAAILPMPGGVPIRRVHLVSLLLGASVCLTIGLASLLDTEAAFVAIAVQGAGLLFIDRRFGSSLRVEINAAILLFVAAMFVLIDSLEAWDENAAVGVDIVHLAVIAILAAAVWDTGHEIVRRWGGGVVLGLTLIWLGSVLVHAPEGQAAVSVSWAVVGTGLLIIGAMRKLPDPGAAGLAVLALTVGKLLFVDMQEVDTLWRAGLFLLVGLGLMRLGFLLPRLTGRPQATERQ